MGKPTKIKPEDFRLHKKVPAFVVQGFSKGFSPASVWIESNVHDVELTVKEAKQLIKLLKNAVKTAEGDK